MNQQFDKASGSYDAEFTYSKIGMAQRNRVWNYLRSVLINEKITSVLELNCGTGEDAQFLAAQGCKVTATDISLEMLKVAESKLMESRYKDLVTFERLDISKPSLVQHSKYDMVFSNFGGLNCVDFKSMDGLAQFIHSKLNLNGHCILVIMPPFSIVERVYRLLKGQQHIYKVRSTLRVQDVQVNGENVKTFYYSTSEITTYFKQFCIVDARSVGYLPSYFEKSRKLNIMLRLEKTFHALFNLPNRSDHYLIHLQKIC